MRKFFIFLLLILFFGGGFYLGYKFREREIISLNENINTLKEKLSKTEKSLSEKKKEFKKQIDLLKEEWKERRKEIDKLEEKIENIFKKFGEFIESGKIKEKEKSETEIKKRKI